MEMVEIVLKTHIFFAVTTFIVGGFVILLKKASEIHKGIGKAYFIGMLVTVLSAFALISFEEYWNPMMLFIGLFMLYLVVAGYRSLKLKVIFSPDKVKKIDKIISGLMGVCSIGMIFYGGLMLQQGDKWGIPLMIYGLIGGINVFQDFRMFRSISPDGFVWMKFHASKMVGSYIGTSTAIIVTRYNNELGIYAWFLTIILGLIYMAYWVRKIKNDPTSVFNW